MMKACLNCDNKHFCPTHLKILALIMELNSIGD